MSSSFVSFRGRGFEASDATLEIWLALLVREMDQVPHAPEWLLEIRGEWLLQATAGFDFGVTPALDRLVMGEEQRLIILDLARHALQRLDDYGPTISSDQLNAFGTGGEDSKFMADIPIADLRRPGRYFIKLLEGTLTPEESDSRFPDNEDIPRQTDRRGR